MSKSTKPGFFCDFDGTISMTDMISRIMLEFVPDASGPIIDRVQSREISVRDGVSQMFELIPSEWFPRVRQFATENVVIRQGFGEFVDYCAGNNLFLAVVSGGFDFFVEPALAPYVGKLQIFCNGIDDTGEYLRTVWNYPCDESCTNDCGLCKPTIIRRFKDEISPVVVIGDGVTDIPAALSADFVFARDRLLKECESRGLQHRSFDTFEDIVRDMMNRKDELNLAY